MLLVFDVGNTYTVIGLFDQDNLVADWKLQTDYRRTSDEYGILLKGLFNEVELTPQVVKAAIISSVVPTITGIISQIISRYFEVEPLVVGPGVKTGLSIKYENPREIGADRIVNAVAGIRLYGAPLIIVDFGTATTFCAIGNGGEYLGGAIGPGLDISSEALFQHTAKLPRIELIRPKTVVGKNTVHSMQSGLYYGYIGLVEGLIRRIKAEMGEDPQVVATGGLAAMIAKDVPEINGINPNLTLEGLKFIYQLNAISNR